MPDYESERNIIAQQIALRLESIRKSVYLPRRPIGAIQAAFKGSGRGPEPIPTDGWVPFAVRDRWGGVDQTVWFRMQAIVPQEMDGQRVVALICPHQGNHGNSLVYINGEPRQGLDKNRDEILLAEKAKAGVTYDIVLEAVAAPECDNRHDFMYADIAVMNVEEATLLLGRGRIAADPSPVSGPTAGPDAAALRALTAFGPSVIAVTAGAEGTTVVTPDLVEHIPARRVEVRYDIGAGDTFHAGFIAALLRGHDPIAAARLGSTAAALRISREDDMRSLPTWDEVDLGAQDEYGEDGPTLEGAPL